MTKTEANKIQLKNHTHQKNQMNQGSDNGKGDALSLPKGWDKKKLSEVCKVIAGQSPEGKFYIFAGNGMPFYQGKKEYGEKYIGEPTTWTTKITKEAESGDLADRGDDYRQVRFGN